MLQISVNYAHKNLDTAVDFCCQCIVMLHLNNIEYEQNCFDVRKESQALILFSLWS